MRKSRERWIIGPKYMMMLRVILAAFSSIFSRTRREGGTMRIVEPSHATSTTMLFSTSMSRLTSSIFGTSWSMVVPLFKSTAHNSATAPFLEVLVVTLPESACPPSMVKLITGRVFSVASMVFQSYGRRPVFQNRRRVKVRKRRRFRTLVRFSLQATVRYYRTVGSLRIAFSRRQKLRYNRNDCIAMSRRVRAGFFLPAQVPGALGNIFGSGQTLDQTSPAPSF